MLKRCSHFDLDNNETNAGKQCELIVQDRELQLADCETDLAREISVAAKMQKSIPRSAEEHHFTGFLKTSFGVGHDDEKANATIVRMLSDAGISKTSTSKGDKHKFMNSKEQVKAADQIWELREQTHLLRKLVKELVGRERSLRYFRAVRDIQSLRERLQVSCVGCGRTDVSFDDIAVLSSCGHSGCMACVKRNALDDKCVSSELGCRSLARTLNVIEGKTLGVDDTERKTEGKNLGKKLEMVTDLIK